MAVVIDLVGSTVIAGMILLSVFGLIGNLNHTTVEKTYCLNMQTNIVTLARIVEYDLVKIGYHVSKPAILYADSTSISFKSDLHKNGDSVIVRYSIGDSLESTVAGTANPRDRMFYREETGQPTIEANIGLTYLKFRFLDSLGVETTDLNAIRAIHIKIGIESHDSMEACAEEVCTEDHTSAMMYEGSFWEKTIYPRNL